MGILWLQPHPSPGKLELLLSSFFTRKISCSGNSHKRPTATQLVAASQNGTSQSQALQLPCPAGPQVTGCAFHPLGPLCVSATAREFVGGGDPLKNRKATGNIVLLGGFLLNTLSVDRYLLINYYVPGSLLDTRDLARKQTSSLCSEGTCLLVSRRHNKQMSHGRC